MWRNGIGWTETQDNENNSFQPHGVSLNPNSIIPLHFVHKQCLVLVIGITDDK